MKRKINASAVLKQTQDLVAKTSPEVVAMLPQRLDQIRSQELYLQWPKAGGGTFESFTECVSASQPYGLGLGQHKQWVTPLQVYHLCDGFCELQLALRPFVLERLPALGKHGTNQHRKSGVDNVNSTIGGNGEEYLLRRLKRQDAKNGTDYAQKWARGEIVSVRKAAIAAGIVTAKTGGRPLKKDEDPVAMIKKYWARCSGHQKRSVRSWLAKQGKRLAGNT